MENPRPFGGPTAADAAPAATLTLLLAFTPVAAMADRDHPRGPITVGQYFILDQSANLAGGGLLKSDCTQDAMVVTATRIGPGREDVSVNKLVGTTWTNDPDPAVPPYSSWAVPEVLKGRPRLFLCYAVEPISGKALPWPQFCDWIPRDGWRPMEFDTDRDGKRDILLSLNYLAGSRLCRD